MRFLLDTHIWLWTLLDPSRLSPAVRGFLVDPESDLRLSSVSVWESLLLIERGRIAVDGDPEGWIREALRRSPVTEAPLTHEIAIESRRIPLAHPDPADRFLAATARVHGLTLVTADRRLLRAEGVCEVLANE